MQEFFIFAITIVLVSMSGVMSPGPLFASNILYGIKQGTKSGIRVAAGHAVVELPLVVVIGIGLVSLEAIDSFRTVIVIAGTLGLFGFAALHLYGIISKPASASIRQKHGPFLAGVILSGLNPFFIIWWLTVGLTLISDSVSMWSFYGIFVMFGIHIWMDFAWLGVTACLASKSNRFLSEKSYKIIRIMTSVILVYFGIALLIDGDLAAF